jgi:hypothetical protein
MLSMLLAVVLACTGVAVAPGEAHAAKKSATITVSQVQKHFNGKVGNRALGRKYNHYCLMFVATCWASKLKTEYYSVCCARRYGALNRDSKSMANIPIGADVFFTGSGTRCPSCRRPAGHVGVYVGDGYMVHSMGGRIRRDKVADIAAVGNLSYYGWGYHEGVKVKADKGKHPRGEVQQVEAGMGEVTVSGWALDDSSPKKSVKVKVYIGAPSAGGEEHVIRANVKDAELNETLGVTGKHRFSTTIETNLSGKRTLYFYAVNIGIGNDQDAVGQGLQSLGKGEQDGGGEDVEGRQAHREGDVEGDEGRRRLSGAPEHRQVLQGKRYDPKGQGREGDDPEGVEASARRPLLRAGAHLQEAGRRDLLLQMVQGKSCEDDREKRLR